MTSQTGLSLAVLCHPPALSSKTSLKIVGCPRWSLTKRLHWRWRPIGASPLLPARSLTDLHTATAALFARRQPHRAPFLHSAWTVQQVLAEECRILELSHFELGTPTLAAWIQVLEKRLSLWCQQCQQHGPQSPRWLLARVLSGGIGKGRSEHCRHLRPKSAILFGVQAQLQWELCVVPLVRVQGSACFLTLSPIMCSSAVPSLKTRDEVPLSQGSRT